MKNGTEAKPAVFIFDRQGRCVISLFSSLFDHCLESRLGDRFPGAFDSKKAA